MLSEASAMTPFRAALSLVLSLGVETTFQRAPSQCCTMGFNRVVQVNDSPTAQTSFVDTAATAFSTLPVLLFWQSGVLPGFGLLTVFHEVPSQCWVRVRETLRLLSFWYPTDQASVGEIAATAFKVLP